MIKFKNILLSSLVFTAFIPASVLAVPSPPGGGQGGPTSSSANITYTGATTFSSSKTEDGKTYVSSTGSEQALLASGGTSTINSCTITKSGDASGDEADFYGTNAGVLAYNGATLNITGCTIQSNGSHANAVFSYGTGIINISDSKITTTKDNSGGIMVTGGGTLTAKNLTVKTSGNSSASIRSDRGGGTLTVTGGTYETSGTGSPSIYSTADITVKDAALTSTASEGVVVEGANSITLENVELTDTNNTLNGNSETYKNIFLYQSMSGDADEGNASFAAKNSTITTNKGDTIFVTNTTATVDLENNTFTNTDGDFLRIQTGKWGSSGSNGGNVTLNMTNQKVEGNIIVDSISTLNLNLNNESVLMGAIDSENQAKNIELSLSDDSVLVLSDDTYLDTLNNEVSDNSNIYLNGHKLYVNGKETNANEGEYKSNNESTKEENSTKTQTESKNTSKYKIILAAICAFLIILIIFALIKTKNKTN